MTVFRHALFGIFGPDCTTRKADTCQVEMCGMGHGYGSDLQTPRVFLFILIFYTCTFALATTVPFFKG